VIAPSTTRARICAELALLRDKKIDLPFKKHSNMPL
jgi:acetyl-CoA carboxylase carboxyltransferase component